MYKVCTISVIVNVLVNSKVILLLSDYIDSFSRVRYLVILSALYIKIVLVLELVGIVSPRFLIVLSTKVLVILVSLVCVEAIIVLVIIDSKVLCLVILLTLYIEVVLSVDLVSISLIIFLNLVFIIIKIRIEAIIASNYQELLVYIILEI